MRVVDIPRALFEAVVPAAEELKWLTHVRKVDLKHKPTESLASGTTYSVVVGNRFPGSEKGKYIKNVVYLVSLEGYDGYLPAADGTPSSHLADYDQVRLIVLANWHFSSEDYPANFAQLTAHLKPEPLRTPIIKG